jgi:hypothetical protein
LIQEAWPKNLEKIGLPDPAKTVFSRLLIFRSIRAENLVLADFSGRPVFCSCLKYGLRIRLGKPACFFPGREMITAATLVDEPEVELAQFNFQSSLSSCAGGLILAGGCYRIVVLV